MTEQKKEQPERSSQEMTCWEKFIKAAKWAHPMGRDIVPED